MSEPHKHKFEKWHVTTMGIVARNCVYCNHEEHSTAEKVIRNLGNEVEKLNGIWKSADQRCPQCGSGIVPLQTAEREAIAKAVKNLSVEDIADTLEDLSDSIIAGEFAKGK